MSETGRLQSLAQVGRDLRVQGYRFMVVTPETHRRVLERPHAPRAESPQLHHLRQFFGWNRWVEESQIPSGILRQLEKAELIEGRGTEVRSRVRYATLGDHLFAHSPFPTEAEDSVFFGPDSYRFVRFLKQLALRPKKVLDIGCGSGVGGLSFHPQDVHKVLSDINHEALLFAQANAMINGCERIEVLHSNVLKSAPHGADLLIANPPFIMDPKNRQYRDGGQDFGAELGLQIVKESLEYLEPGGALALYTGSCHVDGEDIFLKRCHELIPAAQFKYSYTEIDPDIFGEELSHEMYHGVERIAAVGLYLEKR